MSKKNDDFFKTKKSWSVVKDELLGCYLKPYFQKILHTRKPVYYVDGFAGKGKFDDGSLGSPLIAINTIDDVLLATSTSTPTIRICFIESEYVSELEKKRASQRESRDC